MSDVEISIDITGEISDEELDQCLFVLGQLILNKIKQNVRDMGLIGKEHGGQYLQGWMVKAKNGVITIENTQKYSDYLEFGTYSYWTKNQLTKFTDPPEPKKKDLTYSQRKNFGKGMQSFAPMRKVLFNQRLMQELVNEAFA